MRCAKHGHPMASWSPVYLEEREPDMLMPDGSIREGAVFTERAWRCALHDERS